MRDLADEHGVAVGVVLHDLDQAAAVADHVVLLARRPGRAPTGRPARCSPPSALTETYGIRIEVITDAADRAALTPARSAGTRPRPRLTPRLRHEKASVMTPLPDVTALAAAAAALLLSACGTTEDAATATPAERRGRRARSPSPTAAARPSTLTAPATQGRRPRVGRRRDAGHARRHAGRRRRRQGLRHLGHRRPARRRASRTSAPAASPASTRSSRSSPTSSSPRPSAAPPLVTQLEEFVPVHRHQGRDAHATTSARCARTCTMIATAIGKTARGRRSCSPTSTPRSPTARTKIADAGAAGAAVRHRRRLEEGSTDLRSACSARARSSRRSAIAARPEERLDRRGRRGLRPRRRPTSRA